MHASRNNELERRTEKPREKIKTSRAKVRESLTCWGLGHALDSRIFVQSSVLQEKERLKSVFFVRI